MSKSSMNQADSQEKSYTEPDFFGLYASEIENILSQENDLWPLSHQSSQPAGTPHAMTTENGKTDLAFSNGIGAFITEFKAERLKSLLRDSVFDLTPEVDQMIKPILSLCRIQSCLKYKDKLLPNNPSSSKTDQTRPSKKRKTGSARTGKESPDNPCSANGTNNWGSAPDGSEIDDDLRCILEHDSSRVEELIKKHSGDFLTTLLNMEQRLEEILNHIMNTCRQMKLPEKKKLRQMIQNLKPEALSRVVEIIGNKNHSENTPVALVTVDLEDLNNVTLWRLYFYVTAISC